MAHGRLARTRLYYMLQHATVWRHAYAVWWGREGHAEAGAILLLLGLLLLPSCFSHWSGVLLKFGGGYRRFLFVVRDERGRMCVLCVAAVCVE
jgi:hypothetical protein